MTIRADSYGHVAGVTALTRHLLDGAAAYSSQTRPTLAEVEGMIDRLSAMLNVALLAESVAVPLAHEMVRLAADQWVIRQAAAEVELTHRGAGWGEDENGRARALSASEVTTTARLLAGALRETAAAGTGKASDGLTYTGLTPHYERYDLDAGYERSLFRRGQFDA